MKHRIAILGTVGVPCNYGGFETLAENLVRYHDVNHRAEKLTVYCSSAAFEHHTERYGTARLRYVRLPANGVYSILYDVVCLWDASRTDHNCLLLLGVSGALFLPVMRLFTRARIITNIDGVEWQRDKWKGFARAVLRLSEWAAVRFSHEIVADNQAVADYVLSSYGVKACLIAYGGDHALETACDNTTPVELPEVYALALCRIVPENNVAMILKAFSNVEMPLVFVGNWDASAYGREVKERFKTYNNIWILDPIYDKGQLRAIRDRAALYAHGHSAGGTNPSLVEMMHFGIPVLAYDCLFNRNTTEDQARYFSSSAELVNQVIGLASQEAYSIGKKMSEIARRRYTWERIGKSYFELLGSSMSC